MTEKKKENNEALPPLTPKGERFATLVAYGSNPSEAYREVYNPANASSATIRSNAYKLSRRENIVEKIEEVRANIKWELKIDREEQLKRTQKVLNQFLRKLKNGKDLSAREVDSFMKIIQEQNKLQGLYAPKKVETENRHTVGVDPEITAKYLDKLVKSNPEILKTLLETRKDIIEGTTNKNKS